MHGSAPFLSDQPPLEPVNGLPVHMNGRRLLTHPWPEHDATDPGFHALADGYRHGFPLNLNLWWGPSAPDHLPHTRVLAEDSFALVPPASAQVAPARAFGTRPLLGGALDLVTGRPAIREVDLELPFGGATYRLIRTFGAIQDDGPILDSDDAPKTYLNTAEANTGHFWDWAGGNWMIGESPILLIDAAYGSVVAGAHGSEGAEGERCWLLLDAHRSIPFIKDGNHETYSCPAMYDARLQRGTTTVEVPVPRPGAPAATKTMPTEFYVYLAGGSLKYTFKAFYEDVPHFVYPNQGNAITSAHTRPSESLDAGRLNDHSYGVPYYALLTRIEDRAGHRVEIDLTGSGAVTRTALDAAGTSGCVECAQACAEKGQIRSVRLIRRNEQGQDETVWTLLYVYRQFYSAALQTNRPHIDPRYWPTEPGPGWPDEWRGQPSWPLWGQNAIDSIYVYRGEDPSSAGTAGWLLGWDQFVIGIDAFDQVDAVDARQLLGLPAGWLYRVRHVYRESQPEWPEFPEIMRNGQPVKAGKLLWLQEDEFGPRAGQASLPHAAPDWLHVPLLLKTTVTERQNDDGDAGAVSRTTMYWYHPASGGPGLIKPEDGVRLRAVIRDQGVRQILAALRAANPQEPPPSINDIMYLDPAASSVDPLASASCRFGWSSDAWNILDEAAGDEFADALSAHIALPPTELLRCDYIYPHRAGPKTVTLNDAGDEHNGTYRIYRFLRLPQAVTGILLSAYGQPPHELPDNWWTGGQVGPPGLSPSHVNQLPMRSLLHFPFNWKAWHRVYTSPETTDWIGKMSGHSLGEACWVTVVDRYEGDAGTGHGGEWTLESRPMSRRILRLSPAGVPLWQRTIIFNEEHEEVETSGVGEEAVLDNHGRVIELRSSSWSWVAHDGGTAFNANTDGLVSVFRYPAAYPEPETPPGCSPRLIVPHVPVLEGMKTGLDGIEAAGTSQSDPAAGSLGAHVLVSARRTFGIVDDPSLITSEEAYPLGAARAAEEKEDVQVQYEFYDNEPGWPAGMPRRIKKIWSSRGGAACPDGVTRSPVVADFYDANGRLRWHAEGLVADRDGPPVAGDTFILNYFEYDARGRQRFQILDAEPGANVAYDAPGEAADQRNKVVPTAGTDAPPPGWGRFHTTPAANALTERTYTGNAPTRVDRSSLSSTLMQRVDLPDPPGEELPPGRRRTETRTFEGCARGDEAGEVEYTAGVQVQRFEGDRRIESLGRGHVVGAFTWPGLPLPEEMMPPVLTRSQEFYDDVGRLLGISVTDETTGQVTAASVGRGSQGEIDRAVTPAGGITRFLRDQQGRITHVYRGSKDRHDFWQTEGNPPAIDDDLTLVERRVYGGSSLDAAADNPCDFGQVVATISFRHRPADQYSLEQFDPLHPAPQSWASTVRRSRAMLPVWEQDHAVSIAGAAYGQVIETRVTWRDALGRARLSARFGPGDLVLPSAIDPRIMPLGAAIPTAQDVADLFPVASSTSLLSLEESRYNARGDEEISITYVLEPALGRMNAEVSRTLTDHGGRPVEMIEPGGGKRLVGYDAFGREVESSLWAADIELESTLTERDAVGDAIKIARRVRVHGAPTNPPDLGAGNSVASYTYQWFDMSRRLLAVMELGATGQSAGGLTASAFVDGADPGPRPADPPTWNAGAQAYQLSTGGVPAGARCTLYEYDGVGRQSAVRSPARVLTRTAYDGLGRIVLTTEHAEAPRAEQRLTAYRYENGQLVSMAAVRPSHTLDAGGNVVWTAEDHELQVTRFVYGATVVDKDHQAVSTNPDLVGAIAFPDDDLEGQPSTDPDVLLSYFTDGLLARREDVRTGEAFRYRYDTIGRLKEVEVDFDPNRVPGGPPKVDAIERIVLEYDGRGELVQAIAYNGSTEVAVTDWAYDADGRLLVESQRLGDGGVVEALEVAYEWETGPAAAVVAGLNAQYSRLGKITYPQAPEVSGRRWVGFTYGAAGDADDWLGRVTAVHSKVGEDPTPPALQIASYAYAGDGRVVARTWGSVLQQLARPPNTPGSVVGYPALDGFGRLKDLHVQAVGGQSPTFFRAQRDFDVAGNIRWTRLTHADANLGGAAANDNQRSWLYQHDALLRLIGGQQGQLTLGSAPSISASTQLPTVHSQTWILDDLGNWQKHGDPGAMSMEFAGQLDGTGPADVLRLRHATDARNQIGEVAGEYNGVALSPQTVLPESLAWCGGGGERYYDGAGRLVGDDRYIYSYDAWGRLIQVTLREGPTGPVDFDSDGSIIGTPGGWVVHYTYDALGRLIRRQAPWAAPTPGGSGTALRIEYYAYEGSRRMQEIFYDPTGVPDPAKMKTGYFDGETPPPDPEAAEPYLMREHVYAPASAAGAWTGLPSAWSIDERIAQYDLGDAEGDPAYVIHDAAGDVVALAQGDGTVALQQELSPYGLVLWREQPAAWVENRCGHKGLFHDRLDAPGVNYRTLRSGSRQIVLMRNRVMEPGTGRFLQRDPNGLGQTVVSASRMEGMPAGLWPRLDVSGHFGDGMSTHGYVGASPLDGADPGGLEFSLIGLTATQSVNSYLDATGTMQEALSGLALALGVGDMLLYYQEVQDLDTDWALDWDQPDWAYFGAGNAAGYGVDLEALTAAAAGEDAAGTTGPVMAGRRKGTNQDPLRNLDPLNPRAGMSWKSFVRGNYSKSYKSWKLAKEAAARYGFGKRAIYHRGKQAARDSRGNHWHPMGPDGRPKQPSYPEKGHPHFRPR